MAKTFYIYTKHLGKHASDPKIIVGKAVLGVASEAIHAEDIKLRTIHALYPQTSFGGGTVAFAKVSPYGTAYGSRTMPERNYASVFIKNLGSAGRHSDLTTGSFSLSFVAFGE